MASQSSNQIGPSVSLGERLEVRVQQASFRSNVQDIIADDVIVLSLLQIGQRIYHHPPGTLMEVIVFRPEACYAFPVQVTQLLRRKDTALSLLQVQALGPPRRVQRRENFRVPVLLDVHVWPVDPDTPDHQAIGPKPVDAQRGVTVDLSGGGMQVRVPQLLPVDTRVCVALPIYKTVYILLCRICRTIPAIEKGQMGALALKFINPPPQTARQITHYVLSRQRQLMRRDHLI